MAGTRAPNSANSRTMPLRRSPASSPTRPLPTSTPAPAPAPAPAPLQSPSLDAGAQGAGVFLALFAYPLLVNLLTGGPAQMWGWVKAKWLNQPYGGTSNSGPTAAAGSPAPMVFAPGHSQVIPVFRTS